MKRTLSKPLIFYGRNKIWTKLCHHGFKKRTRGVQIAPFSYIFPIIYLVSHHLRNPPPYYRRRLWKQFLLVVVANVFRGVESIFKIFIKEEQIPSFIAYTSHWPCNLHSLTSIQLLHKNNISWTTKTTVVCNM